MTEPQLFGIDLGVTDAAGLRERLDALQGTEHGAYYDQPPPVTIGLVHVDTVTGLIFVSGMAVGPNASHALQLFESTVGGLLRPLHRIDVAHAEMRRKPRDFVETRRRMHIERRRLEGTQG